MITFTKKAEPRPAPAVSEEKGTEQAREAAKDVQRKPDADGTRRRARRTTDDDRLI